MPRRNRMTEAANSLGIDPERSENGKLTSREADSAGGDKAKRTIAMPKKGASRSKSMKGEVL